MFQHKKVYLQPGCFLFLLNHMKCLLCADWKEVQTDKEIQTHFKYCFIATSVGKQPRYILSVFKRLHETSVCILFVKRYHPPVFVYNALCFCELSLGTRCFAAESFSMHLVY